MVGRGSPSGGVFLKRPLKHPCVIYFDSFVWTASNQAPLAVVGSEALFTGDLDRQLHPSRFVILQNMSKCMGKCVYGTL